MGLCGDFRGKLVAGQIRRSCETGYEKAPAVWPGLPFSDRIPL